MTAEIIKAAMNFFFEYFGLINPPSAPPANTNTLHKIAMILA